MTKIHIREFLEVIESSSLLSVTCSEYEIPYWFLIRNSFVRAVIANQIYEDGHSFFLRPKGRKVRIFEAIIHFGLTFYSFIRGAGAAVLYMPSESGFSYSGKKLTNRYIESFIEYDKNHQANVLIDTAGVSLGSFPKFPRAYYSITLFNLAIKAVGSVLYRKKYAEASRFVNIVNNELSVVSKLFLSDEQKVIVAIQLAKKLVTVKLEILFYNSILRWMRPRLVVYEEGHYQHKVIFNRVAKSLGIKLAEYQHGIIHSNHDAYNYSDYVATSPQYAKFIPDYLLTYGTYWHSQVRTSAQLIPIGNPIRNKSLNEGNLLQNLPKSKKVIVVIGDGIDTSKYINLSFEIAKIIGDSFIVVFRPHPIEREYVRNLWKLLTIEQTEKISLDLNPSVYYSLMYAYCVISGMSTVLYEAVGIVEKIYVLDSEKLNIYYSDIPFDKVVDVNELVDKIQLGDVCKINYDEIWAKSEGNAYTTFLDHVLNS